MKHLAMKSVVVFFILLCGLSSPIGAVETAERISDREIIESLASLKAEMRAMREYTDIKFQSMNNQFQSLREQFQEMEDHQTQMFNQMDKRMDQLANIMIAIVTAFAGIVAATIGFAIWDRRTMIRPFETKVKQLETTLEKIPRVEEELAQNRQKIHSLLEAFRALAKKDVQVAEILKQFSLL
ncbi:MAG: hypothetical protein HQM11_03195 [SAR324 cluster bacterium]|nr:hypothetical protein [SAR324 cluster bacterium]